MTWLAGGQAGREEVTGPREFRLLGPSVGYKFPTRKAPFRGALGEPGGAGGGGGHDRVYMSIYRQTCMFVHKCVYICVFGRVARWGGRR